MAGNQRFSITFDANLNVSQMKGALGEVQKSLNNLHLPQSATKGLQGTFSKLSEEIQKFEVAASQGISSKADFSKLEKQAKTIENLFGKLKLQISDITGLKGKALEKLFPESVSANINKATNALKNYKTEVDKAKQAVDNASKAVDRQNKKLATQQSKETVSDAKRKEILETYKQANAELTRLEQKREELVQKHEALEVRLQKQGKNPGKAYKQQEEEIKRATDAIKDQQKVVQEAASKKTNTVAYDQQTANITKITNDLKLAEQQLKTTQAALKQLESDASDGGLQKLREQIGSLTGLDMSKFKGGVEGIEQAIHSLSADALQKLQQGLSLVDGAMERSETEIQTLGQRFIELGREVTSADARMREVDALKSRIQYFFGLNNTIELVKRTIRSAFQTVKELDKAMTETAVVTDFSVADMWAQLPDYTKRANELGVTTKAAYEAATLYYQQGLKTNEVIAMSNETLKMARIAGLDAAVATDRMTNAIRGFNMEINETNAQRIDDVYSRLAAISASNVDEISTAMTKVASLANSANMEFETTSAFLAQIIETTRESAETAGTALKTVVARFAEVKKLINEDQLRGEDEEGQIIDVNRVQAALRTAGVDLNKFFLGEVGIDDIFMELASKWDSLTTIQQRYIATQAAGSRQQSRFIALMSDYKRMQELVGEAYTAEGASAKQFAKTQESLESKLARLKNAWNEFAMGIANNDLIKAGVDILTKLLNFVNNLTDGFGILTGSVGGFISSILKLSLLVGGLKVGKNLLAGGIGGIGSLLRGGQFGAGFTNAASLFKSPEWFKGLIAERDRNRTYAQNYGLRTRLDNHPGGPFSRFKPGPQTLFGVVGDKFTGTKFGGQLASKLGSVLGLEGAASGAATLAAAIGGVTVVAGAAAIAVKALYDASPAGQVKIAEKYAAAIGKIADQAKKTETSLKDAQTKYKDYSQAISDSATIQDHSKAIQDRNEYLTSLLEQDASFAKYLKSEVKNGEFVLTINEEAFANAIAKAEEASRDAKINNLLAQSNVAAQEADLARAKKYNADNLYDENGNIITTRETAAGKQFAVQAQASDFESKQLAKQAAIEMLGGANLGDELTSVLAETYASSFDANKMQKQITQETGPLGAFFNWIENSNKYQEIYGVGSQKGISLRDRAKAVNAEKYTEQQQLKIDKLTELLQKPDSEKYEDILRAYAGDFGKFASLITNSDLNLGLDSDAIKELATALDIPEVEKLTEQIQNYAQTERERQLQTRDTGYYSLAKGGASKLDIARYLTLDNFADMELVSGLAQKFESSGVGDEIAHSILDQIEEGTFEGSALQNWLQKLNFDSPIAGAKALHDGLQSLDPDVKQLAESITADEEAMAQFSASAQLNYLMTSDGVDELSESLADFIEENGSINSSNIRELAESNAELNSLLETGAFTAKGLAVALEGIATGAFNFYDLNDAIIAALNNMDDLDGIVSETIEDLNNFDPGYDENDITKFISTAYDNITENYDKGAYGNNAMGNYMREIFGEFSPAEGQDYGEEYKAWIQKNVGWLEANKDNMYSAWSDVAASWQNGIDGVADIVDTGSEILITLNGQTTQQLIDSLKENTNLTDNQIRMMIADYKNYSADFAHELALNDASNAIDGFMEANRKSIQGQALYTQQELETLGKVLGISLDEVKQKLAEKSGIGVKDLNILDINTKDINSIKSALYTVGKEVGNYANEQGQVNATNLKKGLGLLGIEDEFENTLNQLVSVGDEFTWDFGGSIGIRTIAVEEGQTAGEALAQAMEAAAQEEFGANFFNGIISAAAANNIEIEAVNIPLDIDITEVAGRLQEVIGYEEQITQKSPSVSVSTPGVQDAITKLQNLRNTLNNLQGSNKLTITVMASGAKGLVVKPNTDSKDGYNTGGGKIPYPVAEAKGGLTRSYGSGSRFIAPGLALTGEEGPEVVWNKEQSYAYITGKNGPEYQNLQPGDRVFDAQETKKILKNSKKNGITGSFSDGTAHGYGGAKKYGTGSKTSGSSKEVTESKKKEEWKNELDWLYNLMEDIAESERTQANLQREHERYLKDTTKTGKDLYELTVKQYENLEEQLALQQDALKGRQLEMSNLQKEINNKGYSSYVWWNPNDNTIEIDWDKIEAIKDKDTYDEVVELVNKAEDIQSKMDTASDAIEDIKDSITELQIQYRSEYIDFEKRALDAVIHKYQEQIDNLSELNSTLNDANDSILNSIREEIDLQRQIRDNTDTENEIADMEARLAYLQRDTTGANEGEIRALEKQIKDARQGYSDTLIDQSLDRLADENSKAAEQRQHQIDLLTAQLDYWKKSGELWDEVAKLMQGSFKEGFLILDSQLVQLIKANEEYQGMSPTQQEEFIDKLMAAFLPASAYHEQKQHPLYDSNINYDDLMNQMIQKFKAQALDMPEYQRLKEARHEKYISEGWGTEIQFQKEEAAREAYARSLGQPTGDPDQEMRDLLEYIRQVLTGIIKGVMGNAIKSGAIKEFATGGLASSTGLAWLDGTSTEPEYVLNARQTDAFLRLAEVLPTAMGGSSGSNLFGGNVYLELTMNVGEIGSDYDVDRLVDRVKEDIYAAGAYRNINVISNMR